MTGTPPAAAAADDKDWTWTTREACAECGFDPDEYPNARFAEAIASFAADTAATLTRPGAQRRPAPSTWSPVEYGQHDADVCEVMKLRLDAILAADGLAEFDSWDGEAAAVEKRYWEASAGDTSALLLQRAARAAATFARPEGRDWDLRGRRGDGVEFTARTLGLYLLHELAHHAHDAAAGSTQGRG